MKIETMRPRLGDRLRARHEVEVHALVHWSAPFTSGFTTKVPAGTMLVVDWEPVAHATGASCQPFDDPEFAERYVPAEDRLNGKYAGFSIVVPFAEIGTDWDLLTREVEA